MSHVPKKKRREEARFPSHYDASVSKVDKVKTTLGEFKIVVFNMGKDWAGKNEYEIEILYPDDDQYGTSTKKFSSTSEAVSYGLKAITEAVKEEKAKKPARKKVDVLGTVEGLGWTFEWKAEEEDWNDFIDSSVDDVNDVEEVLYVVLKDEQGRWIASLGGIVFMKGSSTSKNREYGESIERELATEALAKMRKS
jgi:Arc/MetJ-type ribon-helix-helix transcriptional regulator